MKLYTHRRHSGFTLIEIIVVVAILAVLATIGGSVLMGKMGAGDAAKCREHLEQITKLGAQYSQDFAHSGLLPTSGMADDEDTENIDESEAWWLSIATYMDSHVKPSAPGKPMRLSTIFHCPGDARSTNVDNGKGMMEGTMKNVSYVSWTDATEDPENPNSCIRTTAKQNLDQLPWLSDGTPLPGESVHDLDTFHRMVRPAAERHGETIMVAYANGVVKGYEVNEDMTDMEMFKLIAPDMARAAAKEAAKGKKGKKGKKDRKARRAADEDEE